MRCHVECKNLDRQVTLKDVADKLAQQKFYQRDSQIDHWILISPHHDASNELRTMLSAWENTDEYPFSVQIWSPETMVHDLFALEPAVYEVIYGRPPAPQEQRRAAAALALVRRRLAPRLRVAPVWQRYLRNPRSFCFVTDDQRHFDALYANHLEIMAADERGAVLDGTLMDQVDAWLRQPGGSQAPLLLLADFGEGKSVFTYCLARRLSEEFLARPGEGIFPLRVPLREYAEAGSGRALFERSLKIAGATIADWHALAGQVKTLVILDGFDEMSADLSPEAITENLRGVESCLTEVSGLRSKVLVTSRQRVLDGTRDWERTLDRLQRPFTLRIVPGSRRERVQYLEQFAPDGKPARILANLRNLYDPIGLAAKPLFLQMIRETLSELPDDTFNELVLYETYISKSLRNKLQLLGNLKAPLIDAELIENIKDILEEIAIRLQEDNLPFIYLKDYQPDSGPNLASLLWRMRDQGEAPAAFGPGAEQDAVGRIGIRSLLKAVPAPDGERWPVDFFHRSMREYFVASAIVRCLRTSQERARRLLGAGPLLPEITHFASRILREKPEPKALAALDSFARSATLALDTAYLGGNAITLLHAARGDLPRVDWSGLRLDHARLRGADLSGARLVGTSLRYANLDNANLENADLTDADLEGVRLEETSQVLAVTALSADRILASYEDRSLREWHARPDASWDSRIVTMLDHRAERLQLTPLGLLVASGEGVLSVLDAATDGLRCRFRTNPRFRGTVIGARTTLFAEELAGGATRLAWLDTATERTRHDLTIDAPVTACAQLDGKLYAYATPEETRVVDPSKRLIGSEPVLRDHTIGCLHLWAGRDGGILLAAGHRDGSASVTAIGPDGVPVHRWRHRLHDGPVTTILLDPDEGLVTGGLDRCVYVTAIDRGTSGAPEAPSRRLSLTLRCKNVRFDGVRTEYERARLRAYAHGEGGSGGT